jgi:hypothetical protein
MGTGLTSSQESDISIESEKDKEKIEDVWCTNVTRFVRKMQFWRRDTTRTKESKSCL